MKMLRLLGLALVVLMIPTATLAHDWYDYDCCSDKDCGPIDESRVTQDKDGFLVDGKFRFPKDKIRPSQDGRFHFCQNPHTGTPLCLYIPLAG